MPPRFERGGAGYLLARVVRPRARREQWKEDVPRTAHVRSGRCQRLGRASRRGARDRAADEIRTAFGRFREFDRVQPGWKKFFDVTSALTHLQGSSRFSSLLNANVVRLPLPRHSRARLALDAARSRARAMGRVTVFTLPSCAHCARAKALLTRRGHAFAEISLAESPRRREDMTALCARTSVPQIFLNDAHVGGADDLAALAEADPRAFDARVRAAIAAPDPRGPPARPPPREGNRKATPPRAPPPTSSPPSWRASRSSRGNPSPGSPRAAASIVSPRSSSSSARSETKSATARGGLTIHKRAFPRDALVNALVQRPPPSAAAPPRRRRSKRRRRRRRRSPRRRSPRAFCVA